MTSYDKHTALYIIFEAEDFERFVKEIIYVAYLCLARDEKIVDKKPTY